MTIRLAESEGLIGIEEAAAFLSVKVSWLYEQVRQKPSRVPSYRIGKFRRFRRSELEAWLAERREGGNGLPPMAQPRGRG